MHIYIYTLMRWVHLVIVIVRNAFKILHCKLVLTLSSVSNCQPIHDLIPIKNSECSGKLILLALLLQFCSQILGKLILYLSAEDVVCCLHDINTSLVFYLISICERTLFECMNSLFPIKILTNITIILPQK